jgi:hypothetical protein
VNISVHFRKKNFQGRRICLIFARRTSMDFPKRGKSFLINDFANVIYAALICLHYRPAQGREKKESFEG